jgi:glutamate carboxypeptidase
LSTDAILRAARERVPATLETLRALVALESPYTDKPAVDRLIDFMQRELTRRYGTVKRVPQTAYGDFLVARFGASDPRPIHVMTHLDTVWPVGTLARRPWRVAGDQAFGPGVYDMKAGVALMLGALDILAELSLPHRPIVWSLNTDEEPGSPVSCYLLAELARDAEVVLCLEPPSTGEGAPDMSGHAAPVGQAQPDGRVITQRKGVGIFTLDVTGRAAHAGSGHARGVSAIDELARQILWLHSQTDYTRGTTLNVGTVSGGTDRIVVAPHASAEVDLRVATLAEAERVVPLLLGAHSTQPGATVSMTGKLNKPPLEHTPANRAAFERARDIARTLGIDLVGGATGGGSDGNFTSAAGAATLDGLGCPGDGAHSDDEHVRVSEIPYRTALLAALAALW